MDGWTTAWLLWGVMFLAIELPAVFNKTDGDTLSEHIRAWFALRGKPKGWQVRRLALAGFFAWFIVHLFTTWG
ncbi:hypothetical protein CcI49_31225 [Frankia sp. CcI49]|uniref:hypothetical protein n=1 Tax=Frankia sp. CcI49 TaxID=1745382 RepID=UPI00097833CD|nr:hypothetical protein [Frankia sp. CcI49]ONH54128.1 hypothetical protein CcI49_31225 [Frankia sp. CcI49]